jgi:hypothetical protein
MRWSGWCFDQPHNREVDVAMSSSPRLTQVFTAFSLVLALDGCQRASVSGAGASAALAAAAKAPKVVVTDDRFRPVVAYRVEPAIESGPRLQLPIIWTDLAGARARDTGHKSYSARVNITYHGRSWERLSSARDENARALEARLVTQDVQCPPSLYSACHYSEVVEVRLGEAGLRRAAATRVPYRFKLFGTTLDAEIAVPPEYVRTLLAEMGTPVGPAPRAR